MEYIIVKDGSIIDHLCGNTLPEGAVAIPDNAPVIVGTPLSHYKSGWVPKTEIELITEGLIEMPVGKTWTDDTHTALRDMTDTEKIIAGLADIPRGMHIVSGELVPMTDDEQLAAGVIDEAAYTERKRSTIISELNELDRKAIRPLRALLARISSTPPPSRADSAELSAVSALETDPAHDEDLQRLIELEAQAAEKRRELEQITVQKQA